MKKGWGLSNWRRYRGREKEAAECGWPEYGIHLCEINEYKEKIQRTESFWKMSILKKISICFAFHLGSNYAVHTGENGGNISPQESRLWEASSDKRQDKRLDPVG